MPVRAVRGAIQVGANDRDVIIAGAAELVRAVLDRNRIDPADLISVVFTATPDLTAEFPAYAARSIGITDVPLLCATQKCLLAGAARCVTPGRGWWVILNGSTSKSVISSTGAFFR